MEKGIPGFYIQLNSCNTGTVLSSVVLLFHKEVQLVKAIQHRAILFLVMREGFA
jgi:hypothetical protein